MRIKHSLRQQKLVAITYLFTICPASDSPSSLLPTDVTCSARMDAAIARTRLSFA